MPTTLEQLQYGFDRDSRRVWRQRATTQGWDNAYVYDSLSQVLGDDRGDLNLAHNAIAGIPSNGSRWQYDETGNWHGYQTLEDGAAALTQSRTHDKGNRLMEVSSAAAMRTDRAGRMLETVPGPAADWSKRYEITWDAWSRITSVASVDGEAVTPVATYGYDGLTRRTKRYTNDEDVTLHSYYNDEWRPVEERKDSETTAVMNYLWGSRHRDDLVRRDRAVGGTTLNETRYIVMDYFSPAAITDASGSVTERYQFSAFGLRTILNPDFTVRSENECSMEFAFQGQFEDMETGWLNYGYRYYLPALGRCSRKDPIEEFGGENLFRYTQNSPINKYDRLGLEPIDAPKWGEGDPNTNGNSMGNCWRYACNDPKMPGQQHQRLPPGWDPNKKGNTCEALKQGIKAKGGKDPEKDCCPEGWRKIAVMISNGQNLPSTSNGEDFHFMVENQDGTYNQKMGFGRANSTGSDGKPITNPSKQKDPIYNHYCGELCVPDGFDTDIAAVP